MRDRASDARSECATPPPAVPTNKRPDHGLEISAVSEVSGATPQLAWGGPLLFGTFLPLFCSKARIEPTSPRLKSSASPTES